MRERIRAIVPRLAAGVALVTAATWHSGCGGGAETGPVEVRWDRAVCARCAMAVGDRHYSAQVRGAPAGERTAVSFFDDLGCAVLWLDHQSWRDDPRTEIWVNEHRTGKWIDARQAGYVGDRVTPMDFGLGAVEGLPDGAFGWEEAVERIRAKSRARAGGTEAGSSS